MPNIVFIDSKKKETFKIEQKNLSILEIARLMNINLEGSCEGSLACSTCHVKISPKWLSKLTPPNLEEIEMLGLLSNPDKTSRLGCQIVVTSELDGIEIIIPGNSNE